MKRITIDFLTIGGLIIVCVFISLIFGDTILSKISAILTGIGVGVIIVEIIRDAKKKENVK